MIVDFAPVELDLLRYYDGALVLRGWGLDLYG